MINMQRFERNLGFLSQEEQERLANSSVAIAGAGGDGGMLAISLARMGIGEIRLADPDPFEIENINRQAACNDQTIGMNKALAVGSVILSINPEIILTTYDEGINKDNVNEFVQGNDLLIDETEYTKHELAVMLARSARHYAIPNLTAMNLGFGALVTTIHPRGRTLEKILGLDENTPIDEIADQEVSLSRWLPRTPLYAYADLKAFLKVSNGEKSVPSISPGVQMASSIATTQSMLNILGKSNHRPAPIYAPKVLVMDGMTNYAKIVKFGRLGHYLSLSRLILRNGLKLNPQSGY